MMKLITLLATRVDVAVLFALLAGMFIQGSLFLVGISCSAWPMYVSFALVAGLIARQNRMALLKFVVLVGVCLVFTAYTFSYTGTDVMNYHFPMQDLLRHGWNPVMVATIEDFQQMIGEQSMLVIHTLFLPRLTALCGALVGAATGLYVADSFLNYVLVAVLLTTAYDFSRKFWKESPRFSALFAFSIVFTTKFTAFLSGYVDYVTYAGIIAMMLACALYLQEKRGADLAIFAMMLAISALAKTTGLVIGVLLCGLLMICLWKDKRFWMACLAVALYVAVVGFSPLFTSWIHYGCPLYPTMSFSAAHPPIDITDDFSGNADALKMGYLTRSIYAWVSPWLAIKLGSIIYDTPDFNPVFTVCGGVAGFGALFRVLLLASAIALLMSKKNVVTGICGFILLTTLITPLKYVGFSRYFLQVWAIPPLALFNLAAAPNFELPNKRWRNALKVAAIIVPVCVASLCALRTLAFNGRCFAVESARQAALCQLKSRSQKWCTNGICFNSYSFARRMQVEGLEYDYDASRNYSVENGSTTPCLSYDKQYMWATEDATRAEAVSVDKEFFIADSPGRLLAFPWFKAYTRIPHVLWSGF